MLHVLRWALPWLCVLVACSAPRPTPSPRTARVNTRPNILFVFADDHAFKAISAYGSRLNRTPNLDRLAAEGMRFDRCLVTNSVCGPMRAVIQTGKYSHINGFMVNRDVFDGSQPTVVKQLQKAGYQTALIGKWHLGSTPQGFDHYAMLDGQGQYYNAPFITPKGTAVQHGYVTDVITDMALQWLKSARDPRRPFFLMYQHKAPHRRWEPAARHLNLYADQDLPEPSTLLEDYSQRGTPARTQDMTIAESLTDRDLKLEPPPAMDAAQRIPWDAAYGPRNEAFRARKLSGDDLVRWKYQRYVKDYLRCVAAIDDNLGRVLDFLDEEGLADNTVVIYSSDQGFFLGEHGWFDKRWMYEPSLRTPLLVRWPGVIKPGSVNNDLVSPLDFPETFLDIARLPIPEEMQGQSLVPLLKGQRPESWRKSFYYHYYEHPGWHYVRRHYGVTDGRFKLMHFYERDVDEWELYDLDTDPDELHNLAEAPAAAHHRQRLFLELERLRAELKVPAEDPLRSRYLDPPPRMRPIPP